MSKENIKQEIAEYEALLNDPSVPEDEKAFARQEIADLKKQLGEEKPAKDKGATKGTKATKTPKEPKKKAEKTEKPKKAAKKAGKNHVQVLIDELTDIGIDLDGEDEEKVANLRSELEDNKNDADRIEDIIGEFKIDHLNDIEKSDKKAAEEITASFNKYYKAVPEPEPKTTKTGKRKKSPKKDVKYTYKGREIKELTEEDCEELRKDVAERRRKQAKAEKKSKSKPVIEKIAKNVATAVKQAVKNVPAADLKDDPKKELDKMARIEKLAKKFLADLRSILGEDYDKEAVEGEFKEVHDLIKGLKGKYGK